MIISSISASVGGGAQIFWSNEQQSVSDEIFQSPTLTLLRVQSRGSSETQCAALMIVDSYLVCYLYDCKRLPVKT